MAFLQARAPFGVLIMLRRRFQDMRLVTLLLGCASCKFALRTAVRFKV